MKVEEVKTTKLIAGEGKIIRSKKTHYDEEAKKEVPDVEGKVIYLGKNDKADNYVEVEDTSIIETEVKE